MEGQSIYDVQKEVNPNPEEFHVNRMILTITLIPALFGRWQDVDPVAPVFTESWTWFQCFAVASIFN